MYTLDQIKEALESDSTRLSDVLNQLQVYAQLHGHTDLEAWVTGELDGIPEGAPPESVKHRLVPVTDWRHGDKTISPVEPLRVVKVGVARMEEWWDDGFTMRFSMHQGKPVTYFVPESSITSILGAVRRKAMLELAKVYRPAAPRKIYPAPDFHARISNPALAQVLADRWAEANRTFQAEAYLSTIILLGSIFEGVLLHRLQEDAASTTPVATVHPNAPRGRVERWDLYDMIRVAILVGWINEAESIFSALRQYRNLVHPENHLRTGVLVDEQLASICWEVCERTVRQLV